MLVSIDAQGQLLKVKVFAQCTIARYKNTGGGVRGEITTFSRQSQQRLRDLQARITANSIRKTKRKPVFLTLTYPENMLHFQKAKRDLKVFIQRLRRIDDRISGVWKMEQQKRGSIHFHLILYSMPFIDVGVLQEMWCEVSGQYSKNSLDLEVIRSINGVMYYVNKYMCKSEDTKHEQSLKEDNEAEYTGQELLAALVPILAARTMGLSIAHIRPRGYATGRWWGVLNRGGLPLARQDKIELHIDWVDFLRWSISLRNKHAKTWKSFTLYTKQCYAFIWRIKEKIIKRRDHYDALAYRRWRSRGFRASLWRNDSWMQTDDLRFFNHLHNQAVRAKKTIASEKALGSLSEYRQLPLF